MYIDTPVEYRKPPHGNPMDLGPNQREKMRSILEREGLEIPCAAANNDFSSPIPEQRECQLLMVRELARTFMSELFK